MLYHSKRAKHRGLSLAMQHYSVGHFTLRNKKKKEIQKNFGMVRDWLRVRRWSSAAEPLSEARRNARRRLRFFLNGDLNVRERSGAERSGGGGGSFVLFSAAVKKVCSLC